MRRSTSSSRRPTAHRSRGAGLRYELLKVETRYQYYRRDGSWEFEAVKSTKRVADGQLDVAADKPARISVPVQWGRYRLEVSTADRNGPVTSVAFDAGWYAEATADTPDLLEVALDKPEYAPGDSMTVAVTARTAGKVTLNVVGDRLIQTITQDVQAGRRAVAPAGRQRLGDRRIPGGDLAPPARYAGAAHAGPCDRRAVVRDQPQGPHARARSRSAVGDTAEQRAAGSGEDRRAQPRRGRAGRRGRSRCRHPQPDELQAAGPRRLLSRPAPPHCRPARPLRPAHRRHAGYARPDQERRRCACGAELQGSPPTQKPLALFSGVVQVAPDGTAEVVFDIPDFAGTARVMAVAWSKDKVGRATGDVTVRDPVVLTATLPRFLLNGDRASMYLDLDNVEGPAGDYAIAVRSEGLNVVGNAAPQTLKLNARQRNAVTVPLTASGAGTANVTVRVSGPNGFAIERSYALAVKPATQILARRTVKPLARGESVTLSSDLFADLVPGTGRVALSVGLSSAFDAAALLAALDRYPFGCSEQIASRALPLLYVNDLASAAHLAFDTAVDQRVRESIDRLLARQGSNGSFGLWSAGGDDVWLNSYVTDFLTRAREKNFAVADTAFKLALERLRNFVGNAQDPAKDGGRNLAYALYVLARNGAAPIGDLRYYADTKLDSFATPLAKAQLAAALAMLGDRARAERIYGAALSSLAQPASDLGRSDYGSTLRDAAAIVTLASESGAPGATITNAVQRVETARNAAPFTSTQENAWMVLAARALAKDAQSVSLDVNGEKAQGALNRSLRANELTQPFKVTNLGEGGSAGRGHGFGRADGAGARGRARLQDRAPLLHACRQADRCQQGEAERALRCGAAHDRAAAAVRTDHRRRLSAGRLRDRQSAAGVVR